MPTYVYKFVDTGETIEIQQSFDEPTLTEAEHPLDGTVKPVKKVFLPVGITFKGSGFYKTDSRSGSASKAASSTSSSETSSSSTDAGASSASDSSNGSSSASTSSSSATASDKKPTGSSSSGGSTTGNSAA